MKGLRAVHKEVLQARVWGSQLGYAASGSRGCLGGQEAQQAEGEVLAWQEGLRAVHNGLCGAKHLMWDEAVRQISLLLLCPYCFDGDHFLQVGL